MKITLKRNKSFWKKLHLSQFHHTAWQFKLKTFLFIGFKNAEILLLNKWKEP